MNYRLSFFDYFNERVEIFIFRDSAPGSYVELTGAASPLSIIKQREETDNMFTYVATSKAKIRVAVTEDNMSFLEDMAMLKEGEFFVSIVKPDTSIQPIWEGVLIPDEQSRSFSLLSGEAEITAVDGLIQMKGKKLLDEEGKYVTGSHTLKEYIDYCGSQVRSYLGSVCYSDLVLSNDTSYVFPNILEQIEVFSEAFNDDMGRPISCFEVIKMIAEALSLRVHYDGSILTFVDFDKEPVSRHTVGFKDSNANAILIYNSENITTTRTFLESVYKFMYRKAVGFIRNGLFALWERVGGGWKLSEWQYNPFLASSSDVYQRRIGTGRQQNAFGLLLMRDEVGEQYQSDTIAGKVAQKFDGGETLSLEVTYSNPPGSSDGFIQFIKSYDYRGEMVRKFLFQIVLYNEVLPEFSVMLHTVVEGNYNKRELRTVWAMVDLSGTLYENGEVDWDSALMQQIMPSDQTFAYKNQFVPPQTIPGVPVDVDIDNRIQRKSIDIPTLPNLGGPIQAYVFLQPIKQMTWSEIALNPSNAPLATSRTVFYSAVLSMVTPTDKYNPATGEVVYISRDDVVSTASNEQEIKLNTTENKGASGALQTSITYTRSSDGITIHPGHVPYISVKGTSVHNNITLLNYNARLRMIYNYNQYKIDFDVKSKDISFLKMLDFRAIYDPLRPSTFIYNSPFMQLSQDVDVKKGEYKITAVSMRKNQRIFSERILDETHDLVEEYSLR